MAFIRELNLFGWSVPGTQQAFEGGIVLDARVYEGSGRIEQLGRRWLGWEFARKGGERRSQYSPVKVTWVAGPQPQTVAARHR